MLMQGDTGEIRRLPALPSAWPTGRVTGLTGRGGFKIDLTWTNGRVERATCARCPVRRCACSGATGSAPLRAHLAAEFVLFGDDLRPAVR